jgi:hypothetical protein
VWCSCASQSLEDLETAFYQLQSYFGDPTDTLATTLEEDPEFVMEHIFTASALLMMSERQFLPLVRDSLDQALALQGKSNDREKALIAATKFWYQGKWNSACVAWDQVSAEH